MKIEAIKTDELIPYARNARQHSPEQVAQIAASIREFSFNNPVLIDQRAGIIAGHGRVLAAQKLGLETVPCIRLGHLTEVQKRAYIIADNRLAETSNWSLEQLALELEDLRLEEFDIDLTGFSVAALDELFADMDNDGVLSEVLIGSDDVPEEPEEPITRRGDIWQLGPHRLLCGDASTDRHAFMAGIAPDLLVLDPPYEMVDAWTWTLPTDKALVFTDHKHLREAMGVVLGYPNQYQFVWDTVISWYTKNRPLCRHRSAFYCATAPDWDADRAVIRDGKHRKDKTVIGGQAFAGDYHYQPLPDGQVRLTTIYQQANTLDEAGNGKPVAWLRALLSGADAKIIFEPFAGTGTTIIAAPSGCQVHAIEIEPCKVDAIVTRWETASGETAYRA